MASFRLNLHLEDVDFITGVVVRFQGKLINGKRLTRFAQSQTPADGDLSFRVRGHGSRLKGMLRFEVEGPDPHFFNGDRAYVFVDPGTYKISFRSSNPIKQFSLDLPVSAPYQPVHTSDLPFRPFDVYMPLQHEHVV